MPYYSLLVLQFKPCYEVLARGHPVNGYDALFQFFRFLCVEIPADFRNGDVRLGHRKRIHEIAIERVITPVVNLLSPRLYQRGGE